MKGMAEAKETYDNIPIPKELSERVMLEVEKAEVKYQRRARKKRRVSFMKRGVAAAAAVAVLFTAGVNTSEAFAKEIQNIPVIGTLAKIVTFRSYEMETEDIKISVDIPSLEMISEELKGLEKDVNQEIYTFCEEYAKEAVERAKEYRQAFLDTGGTEEEWAEHNIAIQVWYEVKSWSDEYLSLAVMGNENWSNANGQTRYYTLDLKAGKWITLQELLGDEDIEIVEQSIRDQIKQREEEQGLEYWIDDWKGLDKHTDFYLNSAGNPVVVFEKYEIAPGAAGQPEFEIGKDLEQGTEKDTSVESLQLREDYEDNFDVDPKAVAEFAKRVQEAVAERNLEKLADLTGFPVYVGFLEEGIVVETREEFLALGAEQIFTDEMVASVEGANESSLNPSMAGFTLCDKEGAPSITFGVQNGRLQICGINY